MMRRRASQPYAVLALMTMALIFIGAPSAARAGTEASSLDESIDRVTGAIVEAAEDVGDRAAEVGTVIGEEGRRIVEETLDNPGPFIAAVRARVRQAISAGADFVRRAVTMIRAELARLRGH